MSLMPLSPTHPLIQIFLTKTLNELQSAAENELAICDRLLSEEYFPHSMWLMSLRASVLYHLHEYEQAEHQFDTILRIDPYRIDDIDIFSNILYVQDNKLKLSRLAHDYLTLDKDRPEVCCLVGNHYSLRQEHEKAVKYFRRATELDRTYLTAWTLMGHEYVEMKNSHAAIEAYRRAVDINRKDYRAWYGLGQAYELLSMHNYALYYYQHATALRSYDVRLWQAQGSCYEELGRYSGQVLATTPAATTPAASTSTSTSTWQPPAHWKVEPIAQPTPGLPQYVKKPPRVKNRTPEELEIISQTAARFASRLAQDQAAVLNPDVDTPFQDQLDVVNRLLPYHIFQQPKEDLDSVIYGKGKGKAVDYDLRTEIADTKFALECHKRLEKIRTRWRNIKIREGQRASPDTQAYVLAQAVLEADRGETSLLSTELRTARAELERIQKEQRASANAARVSQFSAAPTTPTTTTPTQTQYYRAYPYTYAQPYGNPSANATTLTFPATPVATTPTYSAYQPSGAIPVQLPVASLPALHALGIVPVPATSLPPEGQPQPPAILRGSSANGTMLTLEINVSLLQSAQMHGLAVILNSLVARNAALANANANSSTAAVSTTPTTTSVPEAEKKPAQAS
ncbi:hypothetical protein H1R20_g5622, partial [Candolleomyces eurysporus]